MDGSWVDGVWMVGVDGGWVDVCGWWGWVESEWTCVDVGGQVGGAWESPLHKVLYCFVLCGLTSPLGKEQVFIE